jgi:hypothetical protein
MDEICGRNNFVAANVWQKRYSRENREAIGDVHEYIIVYAKNVDRFKTLRNKIPLSEEQAKVYKNPNLVEMDLAAYEKAQQAVETAVETKPAEEAIQTGLEFGTSPVVAPPTPPPNAAELTDHYRQQLITYADRYIDVPRIFIDVSPERKLEPFDVEVRTGPYELVDQHMISHDLSTGQDRLGDKVEVMEVENPRAFLAGRLIDAVEELDAMNDKDFASILESDPTVKKSIRPPEGTIPVSHRGQYYTPDFIVETEQNKFLIEVKGMRDLIPSISEDVREKAHAAVKWVEQASKIEGTKPWGYRLVPEDAVGAGRDLGFVLSHAVRV